MIKQPCLSQKVVLYGLMQNQGLLTKGSKTFKYLNAVYNN